MLANDEGKLSPERGLPSKDIDIKANKNDSLDRFDNSSKHEKVSAYRPNCKHTC